MDLFLDQLKDYLRGSWHRRFWGVSTAWVVAIIGAVIVFLIPPKYEATARVYVDTQSVLKPLLQGLAVQPNIEQQLTMLSRTLVSRPNVERLVRMADLDLKASNPKERDALIDEVIETIRLGGSTRDNLFDISYRDTDPARAKRAVESLLSIFVESGLGNKRRDTAKAQQFLDQQIKDYEAELQAAERRLKDFKLKNLQFLGTGDDSITRMQTLDAQIAGARSELHAAEEARDAIRKQLAGEEPVFLPAPGDGPRGATSATAVPELDTRIETLEKNLDDMRSRYTEKHPDVVGVKRILEELKKQKQERIDAIKKAAPTDPAADAAKMAVNQNPVYQQLKVSLADAEANVASLRAKVSEAEKRYRAINDTARLRPELEEQLSQLNRDYSVQKANYDQLLARRESAKLTGDLDETAGVADFRIIDPPRVAPKPVAPNRKALMGIVIGLSLAAGIAASFLISQMLPTFSTLSSLRNSVQRMALGTISLQVTPSQAARQRKRHFAFAGALGGLAVVYAVAFTLSLYLPALAG